MKKKTSGLHVEHRGGAEGAESFDTLDTLSVVTDI